MAYLDSTGVSTLTTDIKAMADASYIPVQKFISLSTNWSGTGPYTQTVTISGYTITANSKVSLQPDAGVIAQLADDGVTAMYVANTNGVLTVYAIGAEPSTAMTIQCMITEITSSVSQTQNNNIPSGSGVSF